MKIGRTISIVTVINLEIVSGLYIADPIKLS